MLDPIRTDRPAGQPRRSSLLIVDDEDVVREMLEQCLARNRALEVLVAGDATAALARLEAQPVDLMLTDIRMPGIDGIELLRRVKARWPDTAVIVMSGYAEMQDTVQALRHGAVDFLQKPFELSKVIEAINRALQMKRQDLSRREALRYLERESRLFVIPNDIELCPAVASEVSRSFADAGVAEASFVESIRVALNEMLINAIEHGNLGITYEEKTRVIEDMTDYSRFVRQRAAMPGIRERRVRLEYSLDDAEARFVIADEGAGFDHSGLPDPTNPENLLSTHGRGILITRIYMDEVRYNERGNEVTLIKRRRG